MQKIVEYIKEVFGNKDYIPLHEPRFIGNEKKYVSDAIDSTFVSSVGEYVNRFESHFAEVVDAKFCVATSNGTSALHTALITAGVERGNEVITQAVSFIATSNAINYIGANPVFVDVDIDTMVLSPFALENILNANCELKDGICINKKTNNIIKACVPMHTFGHPCKIDEICKICEKWGIIVIEDCAESLGSYYKDKHTGNYGLISAFSFNGNKIITSGGGGAIVTNDETLAKKAKHLTTTAKVPHKYEFVHDEVGYNYRMPNLNAALLVAQLENLKSFIENKRNLADLYKNYFQEVENVSFVVEPEFSKSNYWLNSIKFDSKQHRDEFLEYSNWNGVMTRPIWKLTNTLKMYINCQCDSLENSIYLQDRIVNIPSSVRV